MPDIQQWDDDDGYHHHQTTERHHNREPGREERSIVVVEKITHPQGERATAVHTKDEIEVRQEGTKVHITWTIQFYHEDQGGYLNLSYMHEPLVFHYTIDTTVNTGHGYHPSQPGRNLGPARSLPPPRASANSFHDLERNEGFHGDDVCSQNDRFYRNDHLNQTRPRSFRQTEARPPPSAPRAMLRQQLSPAPSSRGYFPDDRAYHSEEGEQDGYSSRGDSRFGVGSERDGSEH